MDLVGDALDDLLGRGDGLRVRRRGCGRRARAVGGVGARPGRARGGARRARGRRRRRRRGHGRRPGALLELGKGLVVVGVSTFFEGRRRRGRGDGRGLVEVLGAVALVDVRRRGGRRGGGGGLGRRDGLRYPSALLELRGPVALVHVRGGHRGGDRGHRRGHDDLLGRGLLGRRDGLGRRLDGRRRQLRRALALLELRELVGAVAVLDVRGGGCWC